MGPSPNTSKLTRCPRTIWTTKKKTQKNKKTQAKRICKTTDLGIDKRMFQQCANHEYTKVRFCKLCHLRVFAKVCPSWCFRKLENHGGVFFSQVGKSSNAWNKYLISMISMILLLFRKNSKSWWPPGMFFWNPCKHDMGIFTTHQPETTGATGGITEVPATPGWTKNCTRLSWSSERRRWSWGPQARW